MRYCFDGLTPDLSKSTTALAAGEIDGASAADAGGGAPARKIAGQQTTGASRGRLASKKSLVCSLPTKHESPHLLRRRCETVALLVRAPGLAAAASAAKAFRNRPPYRTALGIAPPPASWKKSVRNMRAG